MDFFKSACQTRDITAVRFGLCDDQDGKNAYVDYTDESKWIAVVGNAKGMMLTFTAIDKCVIKDNEGKGRGRCDAMLTSTEHLYFLELKSTKHLDRKKAKKQLSLTIRFFKQHHSALLKNFRQKKAFLCNKRRLLDEVISADQRRFYNENEGFHLHIQRKVHMD